jgi:hypothetical protein
MIQNTVFHTITVLGKDCITGFSTLYKVGREMGAATSYFGMAEWRYKSLPPHPRPLPTSEEAIWLSALSRRRVGDEGKSYFSNAILQFIFSNIPLRFLLTAVR